MYKDYFTDFLILLVQPYPFFHGIKIDQHNTFYDLDIYYNLNDFLTILIFLRLYFITRTILISSKYMSARASRVCDMYGAECSYSFAVKGYMRDFPFVTTVILLISSICVFAFFLEICEAPLNRYPLDKVGGQDFLSYQNSVWCVFITLTTVGYGDTYPRTVLGRCVILLTCLWGVFIVSLVVVALASFLNVSPGEKRSIIITQRLHIKGDLREAAARVVSFTFKLITERKHDKRPSVMKNLVDNIKEQLRLIKSYHIELESLSEETNLADKLNVITKLLNEHIENLNKAQTQEISSFTKRQKLLEDALDRINKRIGTS